jgi:hypothetical protein
MGIELIFLSLLHINLKRGSYQDRFVVRFLNILNCSLIVNNFLSAVKLLQRIEVGKSESSRSVIIVDSLG